MSKSFDVIVVGAGITGASTAYHLVKYGAGRVLLLERDHPAAGGTGRSAAILRQHYSTPLMVALARESLTMFEQMKEELGRDPGLVQDGYLFLLPEALVEAARRNLAMQRAAGVRADFLVPGDLGERFPWLNPQEVAAVIHEPQGGYVDPIKSTEAYVERFKELGGTFRHRSSCRGLVRDGDRIFGVETDEGMIGAGWVVNACGPWSRPLGASAGIDVALETMREQDTVWEARPGRPLPVQSISNAVDAIYVRPLQGGRFTIGRGFPKTYTEVDPYNYKITADDAFIVDVQGRMERRIPPLQGARLVTSYAALYDVTPDWYPFVGPRAGLEGYCDASGGSGHGFKIGPAIGRRLAAWILGGETDPDFRRLSHDRVAQGELFVHAYGGNRG